MASPQSQGLSIADGQGLFQPESLQSPKTLVLSLEGPGGLPGLCHPVPCLGAWAQPALSWRLRSCSSAHGGPVINKPSVGQVIKFYPSCITSVTTGWGCPELGPPEPAHQGQRPGQPRFPTVGVLKPRAGVCAARCSGPGPAWTQATEGAGPIPPARSQQLLQTETGRSEVAAARGLQAPGPHSIPRGPPLAPHGFLFPSPQLPSLPLPRPAFLNLLRTSQHSPALSPAPQPLAWRWGVPFNSSPPGPHEPGLLSSPSQRGPAHSGLPEAHSHSSQFPFVSGKAPAPMAAMTLLGPARDGSRSSGSWTFPRGGMLGASESGVLWRAPPGPPGA